MMTDEQKQASDFLTRLEAIRTEFDSQSEILNQFLDMQGDREMNFGTLVEKKNHTDQTLTINPNQRMIFRG